MAMAMALAQDNKHCLQNLCTNETYINIKLEMNTKLESYLSQIYSYCVYDNSNMILI